MEDAIAASEDLFQVDRPTDVYLMVGMGAANAGELVVGGRGAVFICLEHFTGRANPETYGMGLPPELLPLWVAHEMAHTVRYTSPTSESELKRLIAEQGGYYDYWATGSRATLRELLVNEGLAVHASEAVAPGFDPANYFGYPRRQYRRLRELEAFLRRVVDLELDGTGIGLRLRYLSGGMSRPPDLSVAACSRTVRLLPRLSDDGSFGGAARNCCCTARAGPGFSGRGGRRARHPDRLTPTHYPPSSSRRTLQAVPIAHHSGAGLLPHPPQWA